MCGIVGIVDIRSRREIDRELLASMNDVQGHRGPDEEGTFVEPGIGFGHRRLSIIDLSSGQQPLFNEDRSVVVSYNGEIYNYTRLRDELKELGFRFRTNCDTEVLVHGWRAWGEALVGRLRGMFAFSIWDRTNETLFLARDRLGIKPLFYTMTSDGKLLFASELKALQRHRGLNWELDPRAVEEYFAYGYVPDPGTIFKSVSKLAPGHTLTVRRGSGEPSPARYWDVEFSSAPGLDEQRVEEELIERLREAVRIRLMSEVPLGAFLSGGVDSSAVVAMMAGLSTSPVNTCSIAFGERRFDESEYADRVSKKYNTNHHVKEVDPNDFGLLDALSGLYDEPFADSSAIPTYRVCELARERVTVALSGDGGDECLAGYRRHRWFVHEQGVRSRIPLGIRRPVFGALGMLYPKADWAPRFLRAKATFESLARDPIEGYFHSVSVLGDDLRSRLFSSGFHRDLQGYRASEVLRRVAAGTDTEDPLSLVQYLDIKTYLPGDILTKVDRASMAHSLEVRVPILDHEFVEWVSRLSPRLKLNGNEGKYIFKRSLEQYLPRDLLYRPKMGFAVPLASWFRGPLKERVRESLLGERLTDTGIFDRSFLEHLLSRHQTGQSDYSAPIWSLLMFEAFLRREGTTSATPPLRRAS